MTLSYRGLFYENFNLKFKVVAGRADTRKIKIAFSWRVEVKMYIKHGSGPN